MRDDVFVKIFSRASKQGKTFGKYINELLENEARTEHNNPNIASNDVCCICGSKKVTVSCRCHSTNFVLYFCIIHQKIATTYFDGYKVLKNV